LGSTDRVEKFVIGADERQKKRHAGVQGNRGPSIVEKRMIDRLTRYSTADERSQVCGHGDPVAAVSASAPQAVHPSRVGHLIARKRNVAAPRVLDADVRKLWKHLRHPSAQNVGSASSRGVGWL